MRPLAIFLASLAVVASCATHATPTASPPSPSPGPSTSEASTPRPAGGDAEGANVAPQAEAWRRARRIIDLHVHVEATPEHLAQAVRIMDQAGIDLAVNLSGGTVTRAASDPSEFERTKKLADERFPGRFVEYMNLDYTAWDAPDFAEQAVRQVEEGARQGAAGFKEFK
ncbi:MAG: hypothetical protein JOZ69_09940, partial [Myxococcales bacterium]|nr:hypothetical protein [Myxococcales bacterium]